MRTIIVDDHQTFRDSLRQLVESIPGLKIVGAAADGQAALEMMTSLKPQLVLMDIRMPRMNGVEACRGMKRDDPDLPVVLYSAEPFEVDLAHEQRVADLCVAKDRLFDDLTGWIRNTFDAVPPLD